jgi:Subtilase family
LSISGGLNIPELRGVAYGANARAYTTTGFNQERLDAAGGANGTPQVFLSNHSWGLVAGWTFRNSLTLTNGTTVNNVWVWDGSLAQNFQENPAHGLYTGDRPASSDGCTQIDHFHHTQATRHLMVFAAGNDRLEGPGNAVPTYYTVTNNLGTAITATNPNYTRDWADGDEGGFDSLDAPGTAKNALTVGACEDIFHVVSPNVNLGFGPNANSVLATFSGAGPTDDGRIKPDVVAVGTSSADLRIFTGYFTLNAQNQQVPWQLMTAGVGANNQFVTTWQGTSAASPTVAGGLALLSQRRAALYPNLTAADAYRGSTWKALIIDGVDDVGTVGPDYSGGHGFVNLRTSVDRINQDQAVGRGSLVKEFSLTVGQSVSWISQSVPGALLQTGTLTWSDPQGPALATLTAPDPQNAMLVNNIDISIEHLETGVIFRPWTLTPDLQNRTAAARSAAAVRAVDSRNNVERITIPSPAAGRYRITVTHSGGLPGGPAPSAQVVSLVLSGTTPELPRITSLIKNAPATEWMLNFQADPGAIFTIQTSTDLQSWTNSGTVLATSTTNSVIVNSTGGSQRFWRLRRGE